jgi:hypothetical protein
MNQYDLLTLVICLLIDAQQKQTRTGSRNKMGVSTLLEALSRKSEAFQALPLTDDDSTPDGLVDAEYNYGTCTPTYAVSM